MVRLAARLWVVVVASCLAFAAGMAVGSFRTASADSAGSLAPMVIHVPALTAADFPAPAPGASVQVKMVAVTEGATVQVQTGTVGKHYHAAANEIQYIVQGQGKFWLGDSYKDVGPGDLIIIPKGTPHAGTTTPFRAIAIKTPPQAKEDVHSVP